MQAVQGEDLGRLQQAVCLVDEYANMEQMQVSNVMMNISSLLARQDLGNTHLAFVLEGVVCKVTMTIKHFTWKMSIPKGDMQVSRVIMSHRVWPWH